MDYRVMTVNERLYVSGNLKKFDKALEEKDVKRLREILKSVDLTDVSIDRILESEGLSSQINNNNIPQRIDKKKNLHLILLKDYFLKINKSMHLAFFGKDSSARREHGK